MGADAVGPILGIETSCDETSASVLDKNGNLLSLVIHSQDIHEIYGGVVPELAARAHLQRIDKVVQAALDQAGVGRGDLAAIAVTSGPGLVGALLVGLTWARSAAFALGIPLVPVHHMEGHLFGPVLDDPAAEPPFVGLLVSGGHTQLLWVPRWGEYYLIGETRDDAVGEAFDKVAKRLGLPYPGGPALEKVARLGDPGRYSFPRPMLKGGQSESDAAYFDFSFSGLKTAVALAIEAHEDAADLEDATPHLAAGFQDAALDVLVQKTLRAVASVGCDRVLLGGGVSANQALRTRLKAALGPNGRLFVASPRLSMDNGAMIARAGLFRMGRSSDLDLMKGAEPSAPIPGVLPWQGNQSQV